MVEISRDFEPYHERNVPTSVGLRMEYCTKRLHFIGDAPLTGHGTGSIRRMHEKARTRYPVDTSGQAVANAHNQARSVAIEWCVIGIIIL